MHPLQFSNLHFEFFNQKVAAKKSSFGLRARNALGVKLRALRSHEMLQRLDVVKNGKSVRRHAIF